MALTVAGAPVVGWDEFTRRFVWRAGEHVTLIGPTGCGKSHLAGAILGRRDWSVVLGTKPRDPSLAWFRSHGWRRTVEWPPPAHVQRVLLWPRVRAVADLAGQRDTIRDALAAIFAEGAWCVYADELPYLTGSLGLGHFLELYWLQGRALGISLVVAAQRPAHVPLLAYSQATWVVLWRTSDARDLQRLGEIAGSVETAALRRLVATLPRHAFVAVNTRTGDLIVSRAPSR